MKSVFVIEKSTGKQFVAVYAQNSGGNLRLNVNGRFYSDKKFDELFTISDNCHSCGSHITIFRGEPVCSSMTVRNNCKA